MSNIFLASDHHLSHSNILSFKRADGSPLRSFSSIEQHDECIITQHNSVVRQNDKIYFLGDLTFHKRYIHIVGRMNGEKILIKGNHDKLELSAYLPYFKDIRGSHQFDGIIFTHIPMHPESLARWGCNVHGHLHSNKVMDGNSIDTRYYNVSMEQLDNYTPISLEQLKSNIKKLT